MGLERTERRQDFPMVPPSSVDQGVPPLSPTYRVAERVQGILEQQLKEVEIQKAERARAEKTLADLREAADLARGTTQIYENTAATHERSAQVLQETTEIYKRTADQQAKFLVRYQKWIDEYTARIERMEASHEKWWKDTEQDRARVDADLRMFRDPEFRKEEKRREEEFDRQYNTWAEGIRLFLEKIKEPAELSRVPSPR